MNAAKRFLAFDIGASNGRAIVGEWNGSRLECECVHSFPNGPVQVQESTYWDILALYKEVRNGLLAYSAAFGPRVDGIGVDTWGVDFGLYGRDGRLLGNPHHHRDSRFAEAAEELKNAIGGYELYARTGVAIERVATITQLFALAQDASPQLEAATSFLMIPSMINSFLTGAMIDEHSNLSNTGLLDIAGSKPASELLERVGIRPGIIPSFARPGDPLGEVLGWLKADTNLESAPVIACATHDTASAVVSVPADENTNWAFLSCGTWSVVGVELDSPLTNRESYDSGLTTAATADGKFMTRKNVTGLWILQELKRIWNESGDDLGYADMVAMAAAARPFVGFIDVDDASFVHPPDMSRAIADYLQATGQSAPADRGEMLRIVLESLVLKYREALDTITQNTGRKVDVLHMVGGGVRNDLLCRFTADALGIPVLAGPVEATAMGNMMIQMKGAGEIASVAQGRSLLRRSCDVVEYLPKDSAAWRQAYARYETLLADS